MTTDTKVPVERVELTSKLLEALLNMTGGDVELQQPKIRALVRQLHKAVMLVGNRWVVELTDEDMRTARYVLGVYTLNRPQLKTRFHNWLTENSEQYRRIEQEDNPSD